jgi:ABC-type iron transport system FetAB ATPase subunit
MMTDLAGSLISVVTMFEVRGVTRLHIGPIDLRIDDGECVSVMGRSGAGKSILLRALADLDPHSGEALLDGVACSAMPAPAWRRKVTYVPADSGWWDDHVAPHFEAGADFAGLFPALGIPAGAEAWPIARLSTGERQRLAILRALQSGNRVLLLDEPTSGLDAAAVDMVETLLTARLRQGLSILLVTHDRDQALRMSSRHFRLQDGRLVEHQP